MQNFVIVTTVMSFIHTSNNIITALEEQKYFQEIVSITLISESLPISIASEETSTIGHIRG